MASLESLNAEFVCRQHRHEKYGAFGDKGDVEATELAPEGKSRRKRGGGAWRAFVHERGAGGGLPNMAELSRLYRDLSAEDLARYVEIGRRGTTALRAGADRAFVECARAEFT